MTTDAPPTPCGRCLRTNPAQYIARLNDQTRYVCVYCAHTLRTHGWRVIAFGPCSYSGALYRALYHGLRRSLDGYVYGPVERQDETRAALLAMLHAHDRLLYTKAAEGQRP